MGWHSKQGDHTDIAGNGKVENQTGDMESRTKTHKQMD